MLIKQEVLKTDIPQFKSGDTVKVHAKVVEGNNERIQVFNGVVIARRGAGISETFTVRKVSFGVGVERIFPLHSPRIEKIEVVKFGKVRRSKLFYLRNLSGKAARIDEIKKLSKAEEEILEKAKETHLKAEETRAKNKETKKAEKAAKAEKKAETVSKKTAAKKAEKAAEAK